MQVGRHQEPLLSSECLMQILSASGREAQCGVLDNFMGYNHFVADVESVLSVKSLLKTYNSFHTS